MKKFTLSIILVVCSCLLSAQSRNLSCKVITEKTVSLKSISDDKNALKVEPNKELKILSYRTSLNQSGMTII